MKRQSRRQREQEALPEAAAMAAAASTAAKSAMEGLDALYPSKVAEVTGGSNAHGGMAPARRRHDVAPFGAMTAALFRLLLS